MYCINPFNLDVTGHKPSKFPKNFGSHRSLGGRPNCFQMWSRFFLPSIASCPKKPPGSHVMNGLSEMSLSDIGVTGHTPVQIDHIDTVCYLGSKGTLDLSATLKARAPSHETESKIQFCTDD